MKKKQKEQNKFYIGIAFILVGAFTMLFGDSPASSSVVIFIIGIIFIGASKYRLLK
ncbi:hypothetical protein HOD82_00900 [bacterium]|nr:hypothetical protein [bacterium]